MLKAIKIFLIIIFFSNNLQAEEPHHKETSFFDEFSEKALYVGMRAALHSLSLLAQIGENVNHIFFDNKRVPFFKPFSKQGLFPLFLESL